MPCNVDHSPRLHEDQPRNADRLFALRRRGIDDWKYRLGAVRRAGDMGSI
jgi:hypothetical protein